ncbi:MAG: hypothetical protein E4H39_00690, partial [Syntrophobacterales bacterium]
MNGDVKSRNVAIDIGKGETVSGILSLIEGYGNGGRTGIIIAHGAGNDMNNPFITFLALGLAKAGYVALRFNFPYREKGRKAPDSQGRLVHAWQCARRYLTEDSGIAIDAVIAAGKSMGGRVASQMVAEGSLPAGRLVFLGYPLHPPGKREQLRDAHLYEI